MAWVVLMVLLMQVVQAGSMVEQLVHCLLVGETNLT